MTLETSKLVDLLQDMKADFLTLPRVEIGQIIQKMITGRGIGLTDLCLRTGSTGVAEGKTYSMKERDTIDGKHLLRYHRSLLVANGLGILEREAGHQSEGVHPQRIIVVICTWNEAVRIGVVWGAVPISSL